MDAGAARLVVEASSSGKYGYKIHGDRMGRFAMLSVLQMVTQELTAEVFAPDDATKYDASNRVKTAQNRAKIDVLPESDYTQGVSLAKHEALGAYFTAMEKLRDRALAIERMPDDEIFIVPADLIKQL